MLRETLEVIGSSCLAEKHMSMLFSIEAGGGTNTQGKSERLIAESRHLFGASMASCHPPRIAEGVAGTSSPMRPQQCVHDGSRCSHTPSLSSPSAWTRVGLRHGYVHRRWPGFSRLSIRPHTPSIAAKFIIRIFFSVQASSAVVASTVIPRIFELAWSTDCVTNFSHW